MHHSHSRLAGLGRFRGLLAPLISLLITATLSAHGTLLSPMSRVYRVYQNNVENPTAPWAKAALQVSDKNAFYTWNQVSQNIPSHDYRSVIPDGHLASGGVPAYYGLDLARSDWPAMPVAPGNLQLYFYMTAVHEPCYFDVYLTKADYDSSKPLTWDGMEKIGSGLGYSREDASHWRINVTLPQRTGRHVLLLIWQRQDPVGEAFFASSDIVFDGTVQENPLVPTPDPTIPNQNPPTNTNPDPTTNPPTTTSDVTPPAATQTRSGDVQVDFSSDSAWIGGYQGQIKLTNLGTQPVVNWRLSFTGSFVITSLWNARDLCDGTAGYKLAGPASTPSLAPGASVTFGFVVAGPAVAPAGLTVTSGPSQPDPVVPTNPSPTASFTTTLRYDSSWGTGFNATIRIINTGTSSVDGWTVAFEAPFKIESAWNGTYTKVGNVNTLTAASWNAHIEPGKYVEVSFGGTGAATPVTDIVVTTGH